MRRFETVVLSDLHLGAANARADELLKFLDWVEADQIVIAGDLLDDPQLRRLSRLDVEALDVLRGIDRDGRLVWLRGNHDPDPHFGRAVLGIQLVDDLRLAVGDHCYLVCHGHRWDRSLSAPQWLVAGADRVYRLSQHLDRSHNLARRLKRGCKRFCRAIACVHDGAVREAELRFLDGVVVGHTHVAADRRVRGVHLLNSGCWTERPSAFVGVSDGRARRYFWEGVQRRAARAGRQSTAAVERGLWPAPLAPLAGGVG